MLMESQEKSDKAKRGRPRTADRHATARHMIGLPAQLYARLKEAAALNCRPILWEAIHRLEKSFGRTDKK